MITKSIDQCTNKELTDISFALDIMFDKANKKTNGSSKKHQNYQKLMDAFPPTLNPAFIQLREQINSEIVKRQNPELP